MQQPPLQPQQTVAQQHVGAIISQIIANATSHVAVHHPHLQQQQQQPPPPAAAAAAVAVIAAPAQQQQQQQQWRQQQRRMQRLYKNLQK
jgi:hypothetical protein